MKLLLKLLLLLLALPLTILAQDATQTVDLGDGYSITVPADWEATKTKNGEFTLSDGTNTLRVMTPTRLQALNINFASNSNVVDVLASLTFPFEGVQLEDGDAVKTRVGERQGAVFTNTEGTSSDERYIAVTLSNGAFGYLSFAVPKGELNGLQALIDEIAASFDGSAEVADAGTSCTVSTETENTAQLRVGPGTNRGAISFLPAGMEVTVTGRIELDDGSVWYQLDKTQAAPNGTPASELWVAAESITENGSCTTVGDTNAPPIIPISVAPPTAVPSSGEQPNNNPPAEQPSAGAGTLPSAGRWTMTLNATTNASCEGYQNVPIPSTEVFDTIVDSYQLTINNATTFTFGGDRFTNAAGTNSYHGSWTFDDGFNSQMRLDVISPNNMRGELTGNFTLDGTPCSATVLFIVTRG